MKFKLSSLGFIVLSLVSVSAIAQSWTYRINPAADHEFQCISPSGESFGGWRSCHIISTCHDGTATQNWCRRTYETTGTSSTGGDLTVIEVRLDQVMQPASLTSEIHDCTRNPACKYALDAAAAYVGIDSTLITSAVARIEQSRNGEEGDFHYILPAGYQYCRVKVETVSVVPATGDRASLMSLTGSNRELRVQTWTPRQGFGSGKSWVEADFTIVGVKDNLVQQYRSKGVCKANYIRSVCRGAFGVNNGVPACGLITD